MDWQREVEELHEFFEGFLGAGDGSLERVDAALGEEFVIIGPGGDLRSKAETLEALSAGRGRVPELAIWTSGHRLIAETEDLIVVAYNEHQRTSSSETNRWSTAVFRPDSAAPNGVTWIHLQETWLPEGDGR